MRRLTIRTRTAITFAVVFMVLAGAVLAFVTAMTQRGIEVRIGDALGGLTGVDGFGRPPATVTASPHSPTGPATAPPPERAARDRPMTSGLAVARIAADEQWLWSGVGVGVAGLVAGLAGWLVTRRMLRPLDEIARTAQHISASTLDRRIALQGPDDELRRLARTVDALFERLESAFASQRHFVAQAAHELRTPIAVQRATLQIELVDDADRAEIIAVRERLLTENRRSERLIESLLVLAEAERGLDGRTTRIELDRLVADVVAEFAPAADRAGVTLIRPSDTPPVRIDAEATLLRQAIRNLVDNAIEYNRVGGHVDIRVDSSGFSVENTGDPVGETVVERLTEPFRRASGRTDAGRRHNGLGLSIVAAVVRAHGWRLDVTPGSDGGLRVRVGVSPTSLAANRSGNAPHDEVDA